MIVFILALLVLIVSPYAFSIARGTLVWSIELLKWIITFSPVILMLYIAFRGNK